MTSTTWKGWSRPRKTGYTGAFGDSFFSDCWDVVDRPGKITQEDVTSDVSEDKVRPMFRKSHLKRMNSGDDVYQVMLDVGHFTPSDLSVKLVNDKTVIVEGKHGEREDPEGFVAREFTRKYNLPNGVRPSSVECFLSSDGVLVVRGHSGKRLSPSPNGSSDTNTIPIFTPGFHAEPSTSTSTATDNQHQERVIRINVEEQGPSEIRSASGTPNKMDRMSSQFGENGRNNDNVHRHHSNFTNAKSKTAEKERTVSFESYEESPDKGLGDGRNSRMSDDAFESRPSPFRFDTAIPSPSSPLGHYDHMTKDSRDESMETEERSFSRNGFPDGQRMEPFPRDLFENIGIPRWKEMNLIQPIMSPLVSKEEHYDKQFEKGFSKNGNWTESFEERFSSEQYSVSSSGNHQSLEDKPLFNNNKFLQNRPTQNAKERLIKISSPA